jgi:acyl carrier protein
MTQSAGPRASGVAATSERTPIETTLSAIYSELLGVDEVGVHDSLFELGGHSLLAMQVLSRARQELGVDLPLTLFFTTNFTVSELAEAVLNERVKLSDPRRTAQALQALLGLSDDETQTFLGDGDSR